MVGMFRKKFRGFETAVINSPPIAVVNFENVAKFNNMLENEIKIMNLRGLTKFFREIKTARYSRDMISTKKEGEISDSHASS